MNQQQFQDRIQKTIAEKIAAAKWDYTEKYYGEERSLLATRGNESLSIPIMNNIPQTHHSSY